VANIEFAHIFWSVDFFRSKDLDQPFINRSHPVVALTNHVLFLIVFNFFINDIFKPVGPSVILINMIESDLSAVSNFVNTSTNVLNKVIVFNLIEAATDSFLMSVDLISDVGSKVPALLQLPEYHLVCRELQSHHRVGGWVHT